jgi:hypothetical protein
MKSVGLTIHTTKSRFSVIENPFFCLSVGGFSRLFLRREITTKARAFFKGRSGEAERGKKADSRLHWRLTLASQDDQNYGTRTPTAVPTQRALRAWGSTRPKRATRQPLKSLAQKRLCSNMWALSHAGGSACPQAAAKHTPSLITGFFSHTYHYHIVPFHLLPLGPPAHWLTSTRFVAFIPKHPSRPQRQPVRAQERRRGPAFKPGPHTQTGRGTCLAVRLCFYSKSRVLYHIRIQKSYCSAFV